MDETVSVERRASFATKAMDHLHDPVILRLCVIAAMTAIGYFAVYAPLQEKNAATSIKLKKDQNLLELGADLESLVANYSKFKDRIPEQTDSKEWAQYILDGLRGFPVELSTLDCSGTAKLGPYRTMVLKVNMEGPFREIDNCIRWLETNKRLLWIEEFALTPSKDANNYVTIKMTIVGLSG
ncbi:MAG: hypothetical protein GX594_11845 [Pirellulaceae bacterium]|nr:hypothetical protein [Pirellulaceae bacterium]